MRSLRGVGLALVSSDQHAGHPAMLPGAGEPGAAREEKARAPRDAMEPFFRKPISPPTKRSACVHRARKVGAGAAASRR
jgi:hypothetical protein